MSCKIGLGYDIHRLVKGRKLFLGGVEIPHAWGLLGHSDADVVLHAICDALLGAIGAGDIGEHFPNFDPKYSGISSVLLLKEVKRQVTAKGYSIGNVDAVILAEQPNLKAYKPRMRKVIAGVLDIPFASVNIKATTQEGLGLIGREKGIAAYAVVLLKKSK